MTTTDRLYGRRVLVTGATGGLGPMAAVAAASAGARLVLVGRSRARLDAVVSAMGEHAAAVERVAVADLLDPTAVEALAAESEPLDAVWHLVGGWRGGIPLPEQPLEDWDWLHDQLVRSTVHVARSFTGALAASAHGRFVIVSAREAQAPTTKNAAYASAKAAAEAVVLALADEFRGSAATANVVVVPAIVTPEMRAQAPDKRWGSFVPAEDIAETLVHVTSDAAAKMNGQRVRLYSGGPT